jgi:hypothetical protein
MNHELKCFQIKRGINNSPTPADYLRLELNPKKFLLLPYHHVELVKFESSDIQDTLTLSFINRTVNITGKNLRDLALALQDRAVEFIRIHPALDRYASVMGTEAHVKTIEIEEKK